MTYLISLSDFHNRVIISKNLKDEIIKPSITYAQEMHLEQLICSDLYDIILSQVENCDVEDRINYLLEKYIKPYLVYVAYGDYLTHHNAKGTVQGIVKILGDNAESVTNETIKNLLANAESKTKFYEGKIVSYLNSKIDTYPEFKGCGCSSSVNTYGFQISSIGSGSEKSNLL